LAQRIVHLLTMHSAAGRLYEVDVRLRPSGKGGLLVTNIDAFADYQREEVRSMRERQRRELSRGDALRFDIKQDPGGIADIEFLAQYWALKWAAEYPPVAMYSD